MWFSGETTGEWHVVERREWRFGRTLKEAAKEAWGTKKTKDSKPNSERVPTTPCLSCAWMLIKGKRRERKSEESRNQLGLLSRRRQRQL